MVLAGGKLMTLDPSTKRLMSQAGYSTAERMARTLENKNLLAWDISLATSVVLLPYTLKPKAQCSGCLLATLSWPWRPRHNHIFQQTEQMYQLFLQSIA